MVNDGGGTSGCVVAGIRVIVVLRRSIEWTTLSLYINDLVDLWVWGFDKEAEEVVHLIGHYFRAELDIGLMGDSPRLHGKINTGIASGCVKLIFEISTENIVTFWKQRLEDKEITACHCCRKISNSGISIWRIYLCGEVVAIWLQGNGVSFDMRFDRWKGVGCRHWSQLHVIEEETCHVCDYFEISIGFLSVGNGQGEGGWLVEGRIV